MKPWEAILESGKWFSEIVARRRSAEMVIVKACFDESGKLADDNYVIFAGCAATDNRWSQISENWNQILEENGIRYLTMKEAMNNRGEFKGWRDRTKDRDQLLAKNI